MIEKDFDWENINNDQLKPDVREFLVAVINGGAPLPFHIPEHGPGSVLSARIVDNQIKVTLSIPESAVGTFDVESGLSAVFSVGTRIRMHPK